MNPIKGYTLSESADLDLEEIFTFSEEKFGFDQEVKYLGEIEDVFNLVVKNPEIGKNRTEVKPGIRSIVKSSHIIFYRINKNAIRIVSVLHGSRELPKWIE
ncbi:MAG: type II toxin-antitoxin system RelE/ParE family toxin [Bacteroidota bacterium]